jgi:hypothetical protein
MSVFVSLPVSSNICTGILPCDSKPLNVEGGDSSKQYYENCILDRVSCSVRSARPASLTYLLFVGFEEALS